jgi:hypothetical protein
MKASLPTPEFVLDASTKSLEDLELAALNRAANLLKGIKVELHALSEQTATAMLARWMLENREAFLRGRGTPVQAEPLKAFELFSSEKAG